MIPAECLLEKDEGTGFRKTGQYFFNTKTGKCKFFKYKGSGGNANRFPSKKACEEKCKL